MRAKQLYEAPLFSRPNTFSFDLNHGFETFDPKTGDDKLTALLEWIRQMSPEGGRLRKVCHEADFVCWRGLLTRISATIYSRDDGWRVRAIRRKGVVFLMEEKTEQARQRELNQTDMEKRMSYWGHKFEQYVTRDDSSESPDTSQPVTTKEEYGVVFRNDLTTDARLNPAKKSIGILYSGEVDCLDKYGGLIELKTQKGDLHAGFWKSPKSLKWWLQSSLVNVDTIIVGHRTHEGHVTSLSTVRTREMPQRATWNFRACFEFTSTIFTQILKFLGEREGAACVVEYRSEMGLQKGITMRRVPEDTCDDIVPEEFLKNYY
ncbi:CRE-DOM-3 protein [Caenorhabditis remanei]|uniref:Decapping nuclease n=1 Tax=Caenorhabditis remanei TaxID=31234 RepID=E3MX51_CAERE|nr:CRE-DOM-3 protein [Caenorhabditis remanei]